LNKYKSQKKKYHDKLLLRSYQLEIVSKTCSLTTVYISKTWDSDLSLKNKWSYLLWQHPV